MSYNNGKSYDINFSATLSQKSNMAQDFSEGNFKLQNLLIDMWNKGIKTNGCCNGHDDGRRWFLSFELNENSKPLVNDLINIIDIVDTDSVEIDFFPIKDSLSLSISSSNEYKDFLLHFMHSSVVNHRKYQQNDILTSAIYTEKLAKALNVDYRLALNKNEMAFALYPKGSIVNFGNDMPSIEEVKDKGLKFRAYKCNNETLISFLSYFYPEIDKGIKK